MDGPAALASHLNNPHTATGWHNVKAFGAKGDGATDDWRAIRNAIRAGGVVYLPPGTYLVSEQVVVPSEVVLIGAGSGSTTVKKTADNSKSVIMLGTSGTPVNRATVSQMTLDGVWPGGAAGNGDGIRGVSGWTDCAFWDLRILNVNRHGVGGMTAPIQRCSWDRILITDTGSDAIDLTNTGGVEGDSRGNVLDTIWIERFGKATSGQSKAGITVRGQALLTNIVVRDFGSGVGRAAIRFRSASGAGAGGERSGFTKFHIDGVNGTAGSRGIEIQGRRAVHVSDGVVEGVGDTGVLVTPSGADPCELHAVDSVHARNCGQFGFQVADGATDTTLSYCSADNCGIGFSIEGDRTTLFVPRAHSDTPQPVGIHVRGAANDTDVIRPRLVGTRLAAGGTNTHVDPPPP